MAPLRNAVAISAGITGAHGNEGVRPVMNAAVAATAGQNFSTPAVMTSKLVTATASETRSESTNAGTRPHRSLKNESNSLSEDKPSMTPPNAAMSDDFSIRVRRSTCFRLQNPGGGRYWKQPRHLRDGWAQPDWVIQAQT